jgi:hypothetical protein
MEVRDAEVGRGPGQHCLLEGLRAHHGPWLAGEHQIGS